MGRLIKSAGVGVGLAVAATALAAAWSTGAPAAQLDEKTCAQLKLEIGQLEGLGARDNLAKGATWGKANLKSNQLEQVKKLIEMDETVAFRCPKPKPVVTAGEPKAKGKVVAKVLPKVTPLQKPAAQKTPTPKPGDAATAPKAQSKTKAAAASATPSAQAQTQQAKPKPKPVTPPAQ